MHKFSPEELIQYLYKETSPKTTAAIEQALQVDWTLREKLAVLKTSMDKRSANYLMGSNEHGTGISISDRK